MNLDFKLNYYFEKYKNTSLNSNEDFRLKFIKEHGNFPYLNELILMINRYQVKKYGSNLNNYVRCYKSKEQIIRDKRNASSRYRRRLGK